jgi:hypothetical protein
MADGRFQISNLKSQIAERSKSGVGFAGYRAGFEGSVVGVD